MKISLNWIKQFTDIDKRKAKELAERLSVSLTEVENIENFRGVDTVLEIENKALTHRPDCFCHVGLAREIATIEKKKFKDPFPKLLKRKISYPKKQLPLQITVEDPTLCPRYTAIVLTDIEVKPSPLWLQERLLACNVKPINNVVDITNFVMLELGQPLHAFDYDKIEEGDKGKEILVRIAKRHERITTLDGVQRELKNNTLVIADAKKAIAIAGIMGGANTQVTEETKTIVIESANFLGSNIRYTGKVVGLHTEATLRFEKNLDPELTYPAIIQTILYLQQYSKAKVISKLTDVYSQKAKPQSIMIETQNIQKLIGTHIKAVEMKKILKELGCQISGDEDKFKVIIPSFRSDLKIEEDIMEEIARIYGYDRIIPNLPSQKIVPTTTPKRRLYVNLISDILAESGWHEIYTYSFISDMLIHKCNLSEQEMLMIKNPISPDLKYVRNHLLPSILEKIDSGSRETDHFGLFEVGKKVNPFSRKKLPEEYLTIAGVYYSKNGQDSFYKIKGILELIFEKLSMSSVSYAIDETPYPFMNPKQTARIKMYSKQNNPKGEEIDLGIIGEVSTEVKQAFELKGEVTAFELNMETLVPLAKDKTSYQPLPKFPSVYEDLSILVAQDLPVGTLIDKIKSVDPQINTVMLKEFPFVSEKLGKDQKSVTFTIEYQSPNKTLSNASIIPLRQKIIQELKKDYSAKLRQ